MNKLPIYELFIEESEQIGLALVDTPAIEKDFLYFDKEEIKMSFNEEKMMVKGPALIPNQLIYRNDKLGERYVYLSEETILKFVESLMSKETNKFNLGHTDNYLKAVLIESYFAIEPNEFDVPKNSWIVGLKIQDPEAWVRIKSGEFKGFSIQSVFSNELVSLIRNNKIDEMSKIKTQVMETLNNLLFPTEIKLETEIVEEIPTPEVEDEKVEEVVIDEAFIDAKLESFRVSILEEVAQLIIGSTENVDEQIKVIETKVEEVESKVEDFGNQPLSTSVREKVATPKIDKSNKAASYFSK